MSDPDVKLNPIAQLRTDDSEYVRLVSHISDLWENAKSKAAISVNAELLDANWRTGKYIVEFEQSGNTKAKYGDNCCRSCLRI